MLHIWLLFSHQSEVEVTIFIHDEGGDEGTNSLTKGNSVEGQACSEGRQVTCIFCLVDQDEAGCVNTDHGDTTNCAEQVRVRDKDEDDGNGLNQTRPEEFGQVDGLPLRVGAGGRTVGAVVD